MQNFSKADYPRATAIPKLFWSDLEAAPFSKCINCKQNILQSRMPYLIEKGVKGFNGTSVSATIFEYAVCMECAEQMQLKLSTSSKERIGAYFQSQVDFQKRLEHLANAADEEWLSECIIHQKPVSAEGECQLYALCQGDRLIYKEFPYMIRTEALDEMMDLISAETLEQLDDFKNDLIDGPPELKELFEKGGPKVLL